MLTSTTYLFLWMAVAASNYNHDYGWINSGSFPSPAACLAAASSLGVANKARCISAETGREVK